MIYSFEVPQMASRCVPGVSTWFRVNVNMVIVDIVVMYTTVVKHF